MSADLAEGYSDLVEWLVDCAARSTRWKQPEPPIPKVPEWFCPSGYHWASGLPVLVYEVETDWDTPKVHCPYCYRKWLASRFPPPLDRG